MSMANETECLKCGSNEFVLERTTQDQILAVCSNCGCNHLLNGGTVDGISYIDFWNDNMERGKTISETLIKASDEHVHVPPREIPEEIKKKSEEELADEMMSFIEKESLKDVPLNEVTRAFWNSKGLDNFFGWLVTADIFLKRIKVEDQVRKRLEKQKTAKDRDLLNSVKPKILEKAKEHCLNKMTESDTELFLIENDIVLPRRLLRMLQSSVNLELKKQRLG